MKIELKNLKINLSFSEETIMFMADLVINGIVVGEANNDGRGGCTNYSVRTYDTKKRTSLSVSDIVRNRELLKQAEAYCLSLPKVSVEEYGFEFDMNLTHFIDNLVTAELEKKEKKKLEKKLYSILRQNLIYYLKKTLRTYNYYIFIGSAHPLPIMSKITHSKYKNTGILFELLVRQIASDTVSGKDSAAIDLVKKYFSNTELNKEYKIYQTLINTKLLTEGKAESLINGTLEMSSLLSFSK